METDRGNIEAHDYQENILALTRYLKKSENNFIRQLVNKISKNDVELVKSASLRWVSQEKEITDL